MNNRRMATPFYRAESLRDAFKLGALVGACIAAPVAAYIVLLVVRLTA